jgi:ABC-three component (ABC-3C) system Middle Component 5
MIQLTYEPALDPYHTVFRFLRLRPVIARSGPLHKDHVRILDFYQLFPFRIGEMRLMPKHRKFRKLAEKFESARPYGEQPDSRSLMSRMEPIQTAALDTLAEQNIISPAHWHFNEVGWSDGPIAPELVARLRELRAEDEELESFLQTLALEYRLAGTDGLKDRTGLLEYRHDAA